MSTPIDQIAPIPGDAAGIRRMSTKFTRMAQAITDAIAMLDAVRSESASQQSESVDALADAIGDTGTRLRDLHDRYEVAGSQLTGFADVLETAQQQALSAVESRDRGVADERRTERNLHDARDAAQSTVDPAERTEATTHADRYSRQLETVRSGLADAGRQHAAALEDVRRAGDSAATAIAHAVDADGLNDSTWDRISGAFKDWVKANAGWMSTLKNILGAVTAVVGLLSIVFPVLAPVALGLGIATAALSFALAYAGEGSWLEFGLDMLGVLTFGVGAVAAKGVGLAMKGTQVMRGLTYNRQATSLFQRVIRPLATRRSAISAVGDEFQSLLPAGQQLMTRMPQATLRQRFTHEWLELSGRQVEQFRTIMPQAQLGANSLRGSVIQTLGEGAVNIHRGAAGIGTALDGAGVGTTGLDLYSQYGADLDVPGLDQIADGWQSVKQSTTLEAPTTWQPRTGS